MMYCPDCQENVDEVDVGDPCPACGGDRRSAVVAVKAIGTVAAVGEVGFKVAKGDRRPWTEKWLTVLHCLDALTATYSPESRLGNVEVDARVMTFFVECDHLRDWLTGDVDALAGVSVVDIESHFQSSQPLRRCIALCNTHKHHTRRGGTTARIRETSITRQGARVTIEVDWATPAATMVDALDLANDCVDSWRAFFKHFSIGEP